MQGKRIRMLEGVLTVREEARKSDAIFVLAGAQERKNLALELYRRRFAPRILLSVGRFEIRRFRELPLPYAAGIAPLDLLAAAQAIPPAERHFFVEFDLAAVRFEKIAAGRLGTLREVRALAAWCSERPEIASLMIVSSGYHLRRVRMCCQTLLPKRIRVSYVAAPGEKVAGWRESLLEMVKVVAYALVLSVRS